MLYGMKRHTARKFTGQLRSVDFFPGMVVHLRKDFVIYVAENRLSCNQTRMGIRNSADQGLVGVRIILIWKMWVNIIA
jgi:hypothetical protein